MVYKEDKKTRIRWKSRRAKVIMRITDGDEEERKQE